MEIEIHRLKQTAEGLDKAIYSRYTLEKWGWGGVGRSCYLDLRTEFALSVTFTMYSIGTLNFQVHYWHIKLVNNPILTSLSTSIKTNSWSTSTSLSKI